MKAVTEFTSVALNKGLSAKTALAAEGKTPEEIEANLGESFKLENPKLKFFVAAIDVAAQNLDKLKRVVVLGLNEGEVAPAKAVKVEEHYYMAEYVTPAYVKPVSDRKGGNRGGKGGDRGGQKSSPWGLSPEEKAAKNKGAAKK